jgi:hypothetical protein
MKITESQLRQIIRTQLKNVLSEIAELKQPKLVGSPTFGELKKADTEAMTARGTFQDATTGKTYPAVSAFQRMSIKDDKKVDIYQSVFNMFTVILNPDGDGSLQYSIGLDTIKRLGIDPTATAVKSQAPKQQAGSATAGLPPRNVAETKLRAAIKQQLSKVLNEMMHRHHFEHQNMDDINEIAKLVNNRPCWNYNNRMYAVFKPAQGTQRAEYWLRKPIASDAEMNIESYLADLLYSLKIINNPAASKEELQKLKNENLPVRDQFGSIGSSSS